MCNSLQNEGSTVSASRSIIRAQHGNGSISESPTKIKSCQSGNLFLCCAYLLVGRLHVLQLLRKTDSRRRQCLRVLRSPGGVCRRTAEAHAPAETQSGQENRGCMRRLCRVL